MNIATFDYKPKQDKLIAKLFTRYPILVKLWAPHSKFVEFSDSPWTRVTMAASQCRLALVTTSGVHLLSQPPFNMKDPAGDPTFREIPADTSQENLTITHDYYDHSDADKDINIVFPIERVLDLKKFGDIGDVNHRHFSFMGHITNHHIYTLMKDTAPRVATALKADGVDIAILTPAWGICNQSVGLIQRAIETAGIATISITLSEQITRKVRPPRALYPRFPLGHPIAFPGQTLRQLKVLRILLKFLEELDYPGSIVKYDFTYSDDFAAGCSWYVNSWSDRDLILDETLNLKAKKDSLTTNFSYQSSKESWSRGPGFDFTPEWWCLPLDKQWNGGKMEYWLWIAVRRRRINLWSVSFI